MGQSCGAGSLHAPIALFRQRSQIMRVRVQTFVDDPIMAACAPSRFKRSMIFKIAWQKCRTGTWVCWIDVQLDLLPSGLKVSLSPEKTEKLHEMFNELRQFRNLIPACTLHKAAGVLGWIIPTSRPWSSMLWAAVYASESTRLPAKLSTRVRKGLTFTRQVEHALHWL